MIKETITILYYLLIIILFNCLKNTNYILYNYIWILILLNINIILFNISYNNHINNIIIFLDMVLSILIIKELNLITKNKKNIYTILLYYICYLNIIIFISNIYIQANNNTNNVINTI